jgi:hypothetical protein
MVDEHWCPNCERTHYPPTGTNSPESCNDCGTRLDETLPLRVRVKRWLGVGVAAVLAGAFLLAPFALVIHELMSGTPLYATRTVTVTRPYGIIPEVAPIVVLWLLVLLVGYSLNRSGMVPRGGF